MKLSVKVLVTLGKLPELCISNSEEHSRSPEDTDRVCGRFKWLAPCVMEEGGGVAVAVVEESGLEVGIGGEVREVSVALACIEMMAS